VPAGQGPAGDWAPWDAAQCAAYHEACGDRARLLGLEAVQADHYLDEGCVCKACSLARHEAAARLLRGEQPARRIAHAELVADLAR
jgi:hypothetical protein